MNAKRSHRRAFTLIEVLLVLLIIGMLATVAIVMMGGTREKAKLDIAKALLTEVETALDIFESHMKRYPTEEEGLGALRIKPAEDEEESGGSWHGAYLKHEPKDPWGQKLNYEPAGDDGEAVAGGRPYKLWSSGPNRTSGDDDDIKNYEDEDDL